jgi:hypothetical protein
LINGRGELAKQFDAAAVAGVVLARDTLQPRSAAATKLSA